MNPAPRARAHIHTTHDPRPIHNTTAATDDHTDIHRDLYIECRLDYQEKRIHLVEGASLDCLRLRALEEWHLGKDDMYCLVGGRWRPDDYLVQERDIVTLHPRLRGGTGDEATGMTQDMQGLDFDDGTRSAGLAAPAAEGFSQSLQDLQAKWACHRAAADESAAEISRVQ